MKRKTKWWDDEVAVRLIYRRMAGTGIELMIQGYDHDGAVILEALNKRIDDFAQEKQIVITDKERQKMLDDAIKVFEKNKY